MSSSIRRLAFCLTLFLASTAPALALDYVEDSQGLVPPSLDGGRLEIEMGDVDADGHVDLVSIGDHGSPYINTDQHGVMVWFGDGEGDFSVYQVGDFGYGGIALGDVDRDGDLDVGYGMHHDYAGGDLGDQLLEVALGDGTGTVWVPWDDGLATNGEDWGMSGTDFADFDNDGDLDIAANSFGCCAGVHVYLNQGDGTWVQSFGFTGGNSTTDIVAGDVNGDGNADLAVAQQYGTVYLGDGAGGFTLADGNLPGGGTLGRVGPSLGDVDGDGDDDLAFITAAEGVQVWLWENGVWVEASTGLPASGSYGSTQLCDMNGDGFVDVVAFGDGQLSVWTGDGGGSWTLAASASTPPPGTREALRAGGDIDHNGRPDIVLVSNEGSFPSYRNRLHVFRESTPVVALGITPVRPGPGRTLVVGSVTFIDWLAAVPDPIGDPASVRLELSTAGAAGPWTVIADDLPPAGRAQWLVGGLPSADCWIRYTIVTVGGGEASAVSRGPFTIAGGATTVADRTMPPPRLRPAYPNPARGATTIELVLGRAAGGSASSGVRACVYDARGRLVRELLDGRAPGAARAAGSAWRVRWDGRDALGAPVPSGVYWVRLEGAGAPDAVRIVQIR